MALEWLGRPYRLCRIEMPEVVSSDDYRRINPVGETLSLLTASRAGLTGAAAEQFAADVEDTLAGIRRA